MSTERIQKILARAGIASRRRVEDLITQGEITVNGVVAKLGDKAEMGKDAIKVSGKLITKSEDAAYYLMYKPRGVLSTLADPENRPTIKEFLKHVEERVYPVGRLDFNSDGAILLTNDGAVAEQLQKKNDVPRVYHVKVKGHPDAAALARLEKGAKSGNKFLKPHSVRVLSPLQSKSEIEFVVVGSGVFDVKSYFELKGMLVDRVTRHALGQLTIKDMIPGQLRPLVKTQIDALINQPELGLRALKFEAEKAEEKSTRRSKFDEAGERVAPGVIKPRSDAQRLRPDAWHDAPREEVSAEEGFDRKPRFGKTVILPVGEGGAPRPRPSFGGRPSFGDKPRFGGGGFGGDRPRFGGGDRRPSFGGDRPRPSFGDKPRFGGGDRPRFGGGFSGGDRPRPSFGGDRPRPSFGGDRPRPSFGGDRPRPSFGGDRPRPSFGDKPRFGGGGFGGGDRPRPSFGGDRPRPSFGGDRPRPSFGGDRPRPSFGDKPRFGGGGFGGDRPRSGGFGGGDRRSSYSADRPSFGGRPSFGDKPRFGGGDSRPRPNFAGDRPAFGGEGRAPRSKIIVRAKSED